MSKKAKKMKANRKRRKTMFDAAKNEAHNYKALAEQYGAEVGDLKTEVRKITEKEAEVRQRSLDRSNQLAQQRETINDLKKIIAGLERDVAERDGTVRELRRQIDQAAPKVMVGPAAMVSPEEAKAYRSPGPNANSTLYGASAVTESPTKKHWTAL